MLELALSPGLWNVMIYEIVRRMTVDPGALLQSKSFEKSKRYHENAIVEAGILQAINERGGRGLSHCVVMHDSFSFDGHYCLVMEKMGPSLYDFMKRHRYQPFPMACIQDFAVQLLETLEFLHSFRLIHTDLKIENLLLFDDREISVGKRRLPKSTRIKVIDFGGAAFDSPTNFATINTRQYRAPEVVLGVGWSMPSDMWSIGCILAELYRGDLLFATHDNVEHLALMEKIVGYFPVRMIRAARGFLKRDLVDEAFDSHGVHRMDRVLPQEQLNFVRRAPSLEDIVHDREEDWFLRLLRMILVLDPNRRATAHECLQYLHHIRRGIPRHL